jgi:hypothetical protein
MVTHSKVNMNDGPMHFHVTSLQGFGVYLRFVGRRFTATVSKLEYGNIPMQYVKPSCRRITDDMWCVAYLSVLVAVLAGVL